MRRSRGMVDENVTNELNSHKSFLFMVAGLEIGAAGRLARLGRRLCGRLIQKPIFSILCIICSILYTQTGFSWSRLAASPNLPKMDWRFAKG